MVCIPDIVSTVTITAPSSGPIIGNSLLGDVPFVIATGGEINEPGGGGPLNSSTPCPPTGQQLRMDPTVVKALQKAWRDSKPGTRAGVRHEEGGWLYAKNGKIIVARGKPGGSETIDLSNPPKIGGALLVADFHTHPGFIAQGYSPFVDPHDIALNMARGVPGLVIAEGMQIYAYGPDRRGSYPDLALDPTSPLVGGYPGKSANSVGCH